MNDDYIFNIIDKLSKMDDEDFKYNVLKLIDERNLLLSKFNRDELTGAYNRWILDNVKEYNTVVLCDIDNFKIINDKYGHSAGDRVLKYVTNLLMNICSIDDVVCRYGGDEIIVIFKNSNEDYVKKSIEIVSNIIYNSNNFFRFKVSFSVGISSWQENKSLDSAIKEADKALYVSKEDGKNTITCYNEIKNNCKFISKHNRKNVFNTFK